MSHFRDFSSSDEFPQPVRNIDSDAPQAMRQELIDLIFHLAEHNSPPLSDDRMYRIISQSLGISASGQPYGGYRYAAGRDLRSADWKRVYDLICRLWPEFRSVGVDRDYRQNINRILSSYGVVWELNEQGRLQRHLPIQAQVMISTAIAELGQPRFAPALTLFNAAQDAFDDRPRRDRDACCNIFDSLESVAKEVFNMPNATFGAVLANIRQTRALNNEVISALEAINTLINRNFGHGMAVPFDLSSKEVDFTYLTCIGAILLFVGI
ncbi:MAG: hypothetical protein WBV23_05220 [Desulfobaccales bacterium]